MAMPPQPRPDADDDERGLSRRTVLTRSASTVGLALTGGFTGLFGTDAVAQDGKRIAGPATARSSTTPRACSSLPGRLPLHDRHAVGRDDARDGRADPVRPRRHRRFAAPARRHRAGQQPRGRRRASAYPVPHDRRPRLRPGRAGAARPRSRSTSDGNRIREYVSLAGTLQQLRRRQVARGAPG